MRTIEEISTEFFGAFDEALSDAVRGIHTQLLDGNSEELVKLCNAIQDSEDDLYIMSKKLKEISDKLMECGVFENVVAYLELSFKTESLIDKLIQFVDISKSETISSKIKIDALDSLDAEYKSYIELKSKYNM